MKKKTTIYDIAKELNITAATVSRALNNNPRISEETKKLVLAMAAKLNYKQNKLALALKSGKSNNVGVVVPFINRNFFSSVIRGIEEELNPKGYNVIISQTHEDEKKEIDIVQNLLNSQVESILISVSRNTRTNEHFKQVLRKNIPLIFFDRKLELGGVSSVTLDDFQGAYQATEHLIEQGCKHIAHMTIDLALLIYQNRLAGYKQALEDHGMEFNPDYVVGLKSEIVAGKDAAKKLMDLPKPPDAIFSANDLGALGAIQYLKEIGKKIPEDCCIVGFSNEPFTQFMEPPISSVDQSPLPMGKTAAKVFLEQINSKGVKIEKSVVLDPTLEIRKSSLKNGK
ncbi:LacI family DNA-binding transcriptional regulator [Pseudozobellia thermophila]|uniref:Transcriptional regulator, LacI family n=1 Tax=Pseudozobellia thermophila TaxID=192903 RepID=A0A1M6CCD9_9FLAO|nr:LacI family DNA-binding transcriptional regulator [Pseudozobellia thermophila]SHI58454.1 transcriptional regulator, LacI family [Pseudozobellia thermophila]